MNEIDKQYTHQVLRNKLSHREELIDKITELMEEEAFFGSSNTIVYEVNQVGLSFKESIDIITNLKIKIVEYQADNKVVLALSDYYTRIQTIIKDFKAKFYDAFRYTIITGSNTIVIKNLLIDNEKDYNIYKAYLARLEYLENDITVLDKGLKIKV